ncbi:hypothetical protein [Rhabdochromatium marinum]|nr:hypothetical protein [Rhabdochromatium marinum]
MNLNRVLRGHDAYYGIAGNFRHRIKKRFPLQRPKLHRPYAALQVLAVL